MNHFPNRKDTVLLGPVPCQGCRRLVAYVRDSWRDWRVGTVARGWGERRYSKIKHDCPAVSADVRDLMVLVNQRRAAA